jgi:hypothetical protein
MIAVTLQFESWLNINSPVKDIHCPLLKGRTPKLLSLTCHISLYVFTSHGSSHVCIYYKTINNIINFFKNFYAVDTWMLQVLYTFTQCFPGKVYKSWIDWYFIKGVPFPEKKNYYKICNYGTNFQVVCPWVLYSVSMIIGNIENTGNMLNIYSKINFPK